MGIIRVTIEVGGPQGERFERLEALVDTGATFTVIPATVLRLLGVISREAIRFRLADGRVVERQIGETRVRVEGKLVNTVVVFGDEDALPLLGVYTLERALLAVDPLKRRLVPTEALLASFVDKADR